MVLGKKETTGLLGILIFVNYSMMFIETVSTTVRVIISLVAIILYLSLGKKKRLRHNGISIKRNVLGVALTLILLILISCAVNGIDATYDVYTIAIILISALLVSIIDKETFHASYVDVMTFFGISSVIVFSLYQLVPGLFSFFPDYVWHTNIDMKNCFLCVVQTRSQYIRNYGVFYEPGMFSLFLVIAIYFSFYRIHFNIKKTLILTIALLSTLSTNGYICFLWLLLAFVFTNKSISKKAKRRMALLLSLVVVFAIAFLTTNTAALDYLTRKLNEITVGDNLSMTRLGSGYERWRSVVLVWEAIKTNPITGVASKGWQEIFSGVIGTATPLNWFGLYGLLYGFLMNYFYLKASILSTGSKTDFVVTIIGMVVFILNIMSQNVSNSMIIILIILFSAKDQLWGRNRRSLL